MSRSEAKLRELRSMAEALRERNAKEREDIQRGFRSESTQPPSPLPPPTKYIEVGDTGVRQAQVCKAAIAALMNRDPAIIAISESNGVTHLSYARPGDGTRWSQKCRLSGRFVIWGTSAGRWRDSAADEKVTFEITNISVVIRQLFTDGGIISKSYPLSTL